MAGRGAQEARSVSADEDGQAFRPGGVTVAGGIRGLVPAAAERAATAPEDAHHLCRLAQRLDPLCGETRRTATSFRVLAGKRL